MMANSIIQFRVDDDLRADATAIYEKLGIDLSTAMRMFLKRSVAVNGIPFSMVLPKEQENRALQLMEEMSLSAANNGISDMSLDEINAEIESYRKERKARKGKN
jgi:DNA-damage-inducible protein J